MKELEKHSPSSWGTRKGDGNENMGQAVGSWIKAAQRGSWGVFAKGAVAGSAQRWGRGIREVGARSMDSPRDQFPFCPWRARHLINRST